VYAGAASNLFAIDMLWLAARSLDHAKYAPVPLPRLSSALLSLPTVRLPEDAHVAIALGDCIKSCLSCIPGYVR
jgi:hypothetical protein